MKNSFTGWLPTKNIEEMNNFREVADQDREAEEMGKAQWSIWTTGLTHTNRTQGDFFHAAVKNSLDTGFPSGLAADHSGKGLAHETISMASHATPHADNQHAKTHPDLPLPHVKKPK